MNEYHDINEARVNQMNEYHDINEARVNSNE